MLLRQLVIFAMAAKKVPTTEIAKALNLNRSFVIKQTSLTRRPRNPDESRIVKLAQDHEGYIRRMGFAGLLNTEDMSCVLAGGERPKLGPLATRKAAKAKAPKPAPKAVKAAPKAVKAAPKAKAPKPAPKPAKAASKPAPKAKAVKAPKAVAKPVLKPVLKPAPKAKAVKTPKPVKAAVKGKTSKPKLDGLKPPEPDTLRVVTPPPPPPTDDFQGFDSLLGDTPRVDPATPLKG
jgi:hypothetical protein